MFNDIDILKKVNIINKVVCYLLMLVMIILVKNYYFILGISCLLFLITNKYSRIFQLNIVLIELLILQLFFPYFMFIIKLLILIIYTLLLKKVTKLIELRYVVELFFYRFKNKKITYKLFYIIYFIKNFKQHFKKMLVLKDDYNIKLDINFLIFIFKQSYKKAKLSEKDFIDIYTLRFYKYSKERTYIDDINFEVWDCYYLFNHIIIFVLPFILGR